MPSLAYQDLIIKITETLIDTSTDHFFSAIKETLGDVSLFYHVDRASIMIYDESMSSMKLSVQWAEVGVMTRSTSTYMFHQKDHFSWIALHNEGKIVWIQDTNQIIYDESKHFFLDFLTKSAMMIPLLHESRCFGFLLLENVLKINDDLNIRKPELALVAKLYQDAFYRQKALLSNKNSLSYIQTNFMQNMSHEMKTPLGGIHHALYLLSTTHLTEEQKSYVNLGQEASDGLNSLMDHLLDITPYESETKLESYAFNMEEEVLRIHRSFKRVLDQKGLDFLFNYDYQINYDLVGDVIKLRQILTQLIDNAIKFTTKGSITCDILRISEDPHILRIQIKDTGIGIVPEHMEQLYDSFFQADISRSRRYQGAGLGLPIVKRWVDLMGGKIDVSSTLNQGSIFGIDIPIKKGNPLDFSEIHQKHVLWMKDQHHHHPLIDALSSMGMKVYTKEDIKENKVDLILLDQKIKTMEEIDIYKEQFGSSSCLMMVFDHDILKQSKKIDIVVESPFSRIALMHKLIHVEQQMTKDSDETSYGVILHGTALVVDDNRLNRIALESILMKEGIDVLLAESGEKAIEMVKKENIDLILMDIQMPVMDGIETTRRIRSLGKKYEKIAIVAVTANAYFNDYDMLKSAKINDVIFKPIHMDHLKQILRKYMHTHDVLHVPDDLFIWDEHDFNTRFEGSESIASEVLTIYLKEYEKDLKHIESAILMNKKDEIIQAVHYFKGSVSYVSGKRAEWVLNHMLEEAKQDHLLHMEDNMKILKDEIDQLVRHIIHVHA